MHHQNTQRGYILLPVVLALALLASIAWLINREGAIHANMVENTTEAVMAEQVARAGLAHATWGAQNSGCAGDMSMSTVPFGRNGNDSYTATVTTPGGSTSDDKLSVDQDTGIRASLPTTNYGSDAGIHLGMDALDTKVLLYRFDLSSLPVGAQINSATAWFYASNLGAAGGAFPQGAVTIHKVNRDWAEDDATWDTMSTAYNDEVIASIPAEPEDNVWVQVNLTAQVQAWVNGVTPNFGIMLRPSADGTLFQLVSKEGDSSLRPRLEVVIGNGPATPMTLNATGTLTGNPSPANDITRTLTRTLLPAYQPLSHLALQPGVDGKDAFLFSGSKADRNTGSGKNMWVSNGSSAHHALVEFNLASLPHGARVLSATLDLYTPGIDAATDAVVSIHRMTRGWVEGSGAETGTSPADGASWNAYDGVMSHTWTTPGGDYDPRATDSVPVPDLSARWYSFDVTSLVSGWVDGSYPNQGLLVRGSRGSLTKFYIKSSDDADTTVHPKLTINYTCECGTTCIGPQGIGTVLLVVVNPTTLAPADAYKKALFESWGYTVTLLSETANQASYDSAAAAADVVYISETVNSSQVGSKLVNQTIGVITEDGTYNDVLGISNNAGVTAGSSINVTDNSHYITGVFPTGPLDIYDADMEQLVVFSGSAPDLQTLAEVGGNSTLVVLEKGDNTKGNTPVAGRRAMLPLGRVPNFNWDYLNANGRLIVQRTLQWGTGNTSGASAPKLLFVVGNDTGLTPEETAHQTLVESWGYTVELIDDDATQVEFDTAVANNDVAFITNDITASNLDTKLVNAPIGVVTSEVNLSDEFGLSSSVAWESGTLVYINDNTHYITSTFPVALLTILSSPESLAYVTGTLSPDLSQLASLPSGYGIVTLEAGAATHTGGTTAGRRVQLPWGGSGFNPNTLNTDGLTLLQRAIEWGTNAGDSGAPADNVLLVVADATNLSAQDIARKTLMEGWGYTVTPISANDSKANFDTAVGSSNVAYVVEQQQSTVLGTKLRNAAIGVVNEEAELRADIGFSANRDWPSVRSTVDIVDNSHYITSPFATGLLTIATTSIEVVSLSGQLAGGLQVLGEHDWGGAQASLAIIATGGDLYGGGIAAARRVQLPWGRTGFDINDLNADGLTIMQRAIEWGIAGSGGSGGGGGGPTGPVFEEFTETVQNSNAKSLSISKPAGTAAGDLLIAAVATDGNNTASLSPVPSTGWNVINVSDSGGNVTLGVWWKLAGASESSSYTFNWSTSEHAYGWIMRFSGHDPVSPIHVAANNSGSSSAPSSLSVNTTVANTLILRLGGFDDDDITAGNPGLSGHTAINMNDSGNGAHVVSGGTGYVLQPATGASGTSSFALTASEQYVTVTLAITPAP